MSENQSSQASASTGPACEGENLIIEVIGKQHPEGQAFRLYDTTDMVQQEWLESQVKQEELDDSILHVWPMKGEADKNVWLEIAADEGAPIRVPFLKEEGAVERQEERQKHVILPVVPATLIQGVTLKESNPAHHVMLRAGFLYLFHQGKLWREIEIRISEQGVTTYHDVPISQYRADGGFEYGSRKATGKGLSEIWLPARIDGAWLDIQVAYSEFQLPSARLSYFEKTGRNREDRFNLINLEIRAPETEEGETRRLGTGPEHAFLAEKLDPQRSRKPAAEWQCDRPERYLCDVNGEYPTTSWNDAKAIHQRQESQEPQDEIYDDERPEMGALSLCLERTLEELESSNDNADEATQEDQSDNAGASEPSLWESGGQCVPDALQDARDRGIGCISVDDGIYRLRYLTQRKLIADWFNSAAVRRAKCRPYFDSAFLVHSTIVPSDFDGKPNPLHKFISELSSTGRNEIDRSVANSERTMAQRYFEHLQRDLLVAVNNIGIQSALTDMFTCDGFDYAGAFQFVSGIMKDLVKDSREADALNLHKGDTSENDAKQWFRGFCRGENSASLYSILFPKATPETLESPYVVPGELEENDGSGLFRGTELAKLENADLPKVEDVQSFHGLELVAAASEGAFTSMLAFYVRAGSGILMNIHGELWSAIHDAEKKLTDDPEFKKKRQELADLDKQLKEVNDERGNLRKQRADARNTVARADELYEELGEQKRNLQQARQVKARQLNAINSKAITAKMRLYAGSLQQIRASLPKFWGEMTFERLSKALQSDYYVIGWLDDLADESNMNQGVRVFGDIFDDSTGERTAVASTNRRRANAQGIDSEVPEEARLLVLPKSAKAAKALFELSSKESAVIAAEKQAEAARKAFVEGGEASINARQRLQTATEQLDEASKKFKSLTSRMGSLREDIDAPKKVIAETRGGVAYRSLNTPVLPAFVMLVEAYNVTANSSSFSALTRKRGGNRAMAGMGSALYDFTVTASILAERFKNAIPAQLGRTSRFVTAISAKLDRNVGGLVGIVLEKLVGGPVVMRAALGAAGAFATGVIFLFDASHAFDMGNTGLGISYSLLAAGSFAMVINGIFGAGLILGPIWWLVIGIALSVAGALGVWWFSEDPIETWMRHGPFGDLTELAFLKDPDEAYYRLISLLMGVRISLEPNDKRSDVLNGTIESEGKLLEAQLAADSCLRIESSIPGLFEDAEHKRVDAYLRLIEKVDAHVDSNPSEKTGRGRVELPPGERLIGGEELKRYALYEEKIDNGWLVYLKAPQPRRVENRTWFGGTRTSLYTYVWSVRAQIHVQDEGREVVFPAPPPDDPLKYDKTDLDHTTPDFSETGKDFWFDEKVNQNG
ncbi:hypothetical protein [Marinobacter bohaiensis]|uniref:hypothetical protein n=1 Tax=Marinobacter bohaiensis TaxID=2201898 RepID=UPI000DADA029|nr:hypothetical protein [Marinobacter bohaiensis]